jgi:peroxiredoxin
MGVAGKNGMKKGQKAPEFTGLPGVDGKTYSLRDFKEKKALVIIFSCNHCPYVQAYEDRIMELQRDFGPRGAQVIAINSNDDAGYPDDSFENMVKRAQERKFNFVYLRDASQDVARAYQATHTPHIFVFNSKQELSYTGRVDDNWQEPSQVKRRYLRETLEALVSGREPAESETFAIGCTIKWKN